MTYRNLNRGCPAVFADMRLGGPYSVASGVSIIIGAAILLFCDQGVSLCAQRVDLKNVRVTSIVRGIDDDLEVVIQMLCGVAPQLGGHDFPRLRVEARYTEVHCMFCIKDANLGALGRGLSFVWLSLQEVGYRSCLLPQGIVQGAVQLWSTIHAGGTNRSQFVLPQRPLRLRLACVHLGK